MGGGNWGIIMSKSTEFHSAYRNEKLYPYTNKKQILREASDQGGKDALKAKKQELKEKKREFKRESREFKREHKMHLHPLMAYIFDFAEEDRALPNSRTPFDAEIKIEHDIVYKEIDGEKLVMDVYYPSHPIAEKSPCVMDIPGGGWMIWNRHRRDGYARLYAALGAVVAVIDHRLCPETFFPENLKDCIDAYNFLVDNADRFGIDKDNITVTGDSSGGHLTASIGCAASCQEYADKMQLPTLKSRPAYLIGVSGAFSMEIMYRIPLTNTLMVRYITGKNSRKGSRNSEFYKELNVYNYINGDFPEMYNNGGATDPLCMGEAKRMAKYLDKAGVKNEYQVGKVWYNSAHCYVLRLPFKPARRDMLKLMNWYVRKQAEKGVDLSAGFARVEKFLANYKKVLKGKIEC